MEIIFEVIVGSTLSLSLIGLAGLIFKNPINKLVVKLIELGFKEKLTTIEENVKQSFIDSNTFIVEEVKQDFIKSNTKIVEEVKQDFNVEIEKLKSSLIKNNLSYQITLSEITKKRLELIEEFLEDLYNFHKYIRSWKPNITTNEISEIRIAFYEKYFKIDLISKKLQLYTSKEDFKIIIEQLNKVFGAFFNFSSSISLKEFSKINEDNFNKMFEKKEEYDKIVDNFYSDLNNFINQIQNIYKLNTIIDDSDLLNEDANT